MGANTSLNIPSKATPAMKPGITPVPELTVTPTTNNGVMVSANATLEPTVVKPPATGDLILGKFKDQAALEAAYKELEAKNGAPSTTNEPTAPAALTIESASKVLTDKGLDYTKFALEYAQSGALSSESYSALFDKGITAQQIDGFIAAQAPAIAAQKATMEATKTEILTHAGGPEEFAKLITYMKDAGSPEDIASYNRAIDSGDKVAAKLLLTNFKSQYDVSLGKEPTLNGGQPPKGPSGDVYSTLEQYHEDLGSNKYKTSPAFRQMVDAKIERSTSLYTTAR